MNWRDFLELTKPKVVALIVFTAVVGMLLAVPGVPPWDKLILGSLGIGLAAASAAVINHVIDRRTDAIMARTQNRPLPSGQLAVWQSGLFAALLGVMAMLILVFWVNALTAWLTLLSLVGYAVIYTVYLKRATPQNIVIGGAAGAAPPVLGWAAIAGEVHAHALLLFLIIFVWTPPHFWALAIHRRDEYAAVDIPMLPVTHGIPFTRLQILYYSILLFVVGLLPYATHMSGKVYLVGAVVFGLWFLLYAIRLWWRSSSGLPMRMFGFSIVYLMAIFSFLLVDHYFPY